MPDTNPASPRRALTALADAWRLQVSHGSATEQQMRAALAEAAFRYNIAGISTNWIHPPEHLREEVAERTSEKLVVAILDPGKWNPNFTNESGGPADFGWWAVNYARTVARNETRALHREANRLTTVDELDELPDIDNSDGHFNRGRVQRLLEVRQRGATGKHVRAEIVREIYSLPRLRRPNIRAARLSRLQEVRADPSLASAYLMAALRADATTTKRASLIPSHYALDLLEGAYGDYPRPARLPLRDFALELGEVSSHPGWGNTSRALALGACATECEDTSSYTRAALGSASHQENLRQIYLARQRWEETLAYASRFEDAPLGSSPLQVQRAVYQVGNRYWKPWDAQEEPCPTSRS